MAQYKKSMVWGCARCGSNHQVEFIKLTHPIIIDDGNTFTHYALCPVNNEPIIMKIIDNDNKSIPDEFAGIVL